MCLFIKSGPHTAEKDMRVLKVILHHSNESVYKLFPYFEGMTYSTEIIRSEDYPSEGYSDEITEGFHSYDPSKVTFREEGSSLGVMLGDSLLDYWNTAIVNIVEFFIPKGATYYIGLNGDFASNAIRAGDLEHLEHLVKIVNELA